MNTDKLLPKHPMRHLMRLVPLTVTLSLTISAAGIPKTVPLQTPTSVTQQHLEQGRSVKREIAEGEVHSYRLDLKAGEFVHVVVRRLGVNVAAAFLGPDGQQVLEANFQQNTQEVEWITYLSPRTAEYHVEVRTVDKVVSAGSYEIEIEEQRTSTAGDELRLSAQNLFNGATRQLREKNYRNALESYHQALVMYRQSGRRLEEAVTLNCIGRSSLALLDYQTAIERYKEALRIFGALKDLQGEGLTLHELGTAYLSNAQYDAAIANLEQAAQARRAVGYREGEAISLRTAGIAYSSAGRQEKAIDYFQRALEIFKEVKDHMEEGRTVNSLGLAYNYLSQYDKAVECYQQALTISGELKDRMGEARVLGNLGKAYYDSSRFEQSIKYSSQALEIFRELRERVGQGIVLNNIGLDYNAQGRYDKAIDYFDQALTISREAKDQANEGRVLNNIGNAYYLLGRYDKATESYQQALDFRRRIHDRRGEGISLGNLAKVYNIQGQHEKSIEYQQQALAIKREVKDRTGEGHTLNDLGNAYRDLGQYEAALPCYEQALEVSRQIKDRVVEEDSLWALGITYDSLTRYEQAVDYLQQSLAIGRELKDRASEARGLSDLMLVWSQQHERPVAIFYGKQAVNVLQEIRGNIKTLEKESQQSYLKSHEDVYRKLADLLISQGRLAEAEKVLELLKEEEFNRILRRNGPSDTNIRYSATETVAADIDDELAKLASERATLLAKVSNKTVTDQERQRLDLIESRIIEANKKIKTTLAEVAKAAPDNRLMIQQSQSMMQTLRKLGDGTVALYTVVANDKGWIILTTPDFRRAYPINTTDFNKLVSDFRQTLKTDQYDPVPTAQKLYQALFLQKSDAGTTLAADLKAYKARTLMWSLDGVLHYVPIGALHDGKSYLVERYPTLVFTTASLTRLLDSSDEKWRALGLGVSKEHNEFPALAAVPRELHSIISETGDAGSSGILPGTIRLDEQFTRQAMMQGLREGYAVVHIASHFRFIPEREESSFLLLGDGNNLSLAEMEDAPGIFERVELLTLSACDTAISGANGKEIEGMAFVAQDLGAKAVVASLWPVADVGTEVLMREFYQLKKERPLWSKSEALRQAQIALLKGSDPRSRLASEANRGIRLAKANDNEQETGMTAYRRDPRAPFAHPHYWAPFILIGNWK